MKTIFDKTTMDVLIAGIDFLNEDRKPLTGWGELWIILEKIFALLLALAIRRKFIR